MLRHLVPLLGVLMIAGCDQGPAQSGNSGKQRQLIQGMHAEFFKVSEDNDTWYEVAISVDKSKTFRMPVFFSDSGKLVRLSDSEAGAIFDRWLKERAKNIAAFGSLDEETGAKGPFLALDVNRWRGK